MIIKHLNLKEYKFINKQENVDNSKTDIPLKLNILLEKKENIKINSFLYIK